MADRARLLPRAELLHYGIVRAAGGADAGDAVLRVDVAGDSLVEVVNGVDEKIIYFEDVVCYAVDDDDGLGTTWDRDGDDDDDDAEDEEDEDEISVSRTTITITVRTGEGTSSDSEYSDYGDDDEDKDEETIDVDYRLQTVADVRALRHVLERIANGTLRDDDEDDDDDDDGPSTSYALGPFAGLDRRVVRGGVLMRRERGEWKRCAAAATRWKLFVLAPSAKGDGLVVTTAVSLAGARVVPRGTRLGHDAGEFDVIAPPNVRLVLAARGGLERNCWVDAVQRAIDAASPRGPRFGGGAISNARADKENDLVWSNGRLASEVLDEDTRAAIAEATRVAAGLQAAKGNAHDAIVSPLKRGSGRGGGWDDDSDDSDDSDDLEEEGGDGVFVLGRCWKRLQLGVSEGYLFTFAVDALRPRSVAVSGDDDASTSSERANATRMTLRVDVDRGVVEAYKEGRGRGRGKKARGKGSTPSTMSETTLIKTLSVFEVTPAPPSRTRVGADAHLSCERFITLEMIPSFYRDDYPIEVATFAFDSKEDRDVFVAVTNDVRRGTYLSADKYQPRGIIKRGSEVSMSTSRRDGGGGVKGAGALPPPRFLVLIPGKLFVLTTSSPPAPLFTVSLTSPACAFEARAKDADAVVMVSVSETRRYFFRVGSVDDAREWVAALLEASRGASAKKKKTTTDGTESEPTPKHPPRPSPPRSPRAFAYSPSPASSRFRRRLILQVDAKTRAEEEEARAAAAREEATEKRSTSIFAAFSKRKRVRVPETAEKSAEEGAEKAQTAQKTSAREKMRAAVAKEREARKRAEEDARVFAEGYAAAKAKQKAAEDLAKAADERRVRAETEAHAAV